MVHRLSTLSFLGTQDQPGTAPITGAGSRTKLRWPEGPLGGDRGRPAVCAALPETFVWRLSFHAYRSAARLWEGLRVDGKSRSTIRITSGFRWSAAALAVAIAFVGSAGAVAVAAAVPAAPACTDNWVGPASGMANWATSALAMRRGSVLRGLIEGASSCTQGNKRPAFTCVA
jgi:hypothetical protein